MPLSDAQAAAVGEAIVSDLRALAADPNAVDAAVLAKVWVKRIYDAVAANLTATVTGVTAVGTPGGPLPITAQPVLFDPPPPEE